MAYRVITSEGIYIQYTISEFIEGLTWELVDCRTQAGKNRWGEISRPRASKCRNANQSAEGSSSSSRDARFLSKEILNERDRKLFAGFLARALGFGGVQKAARLTGLDEKTVRKGEKELEKRLLLNNAVSGGKVVEGLQKLSLNPHSR